MTYRSMMDIRADIEAIDADLDNYTFEGLTPEAEAKRQVLVDELNAWFAKDYD